MTGEEWARYADRLSGELRDLAQHIMQRVSRLLNKDRIAMLDDIQRLERAKDRNAEKIASLEERVASLDERLALHIGQVPGDGDR